MIFKNSQRIIRRRGSSEKFHLYGQTLTGRVGKMRHVTPFPTSQFTWQIRRAHKINLLINKNL